MLYEGSQPGIGWVHMQYRHNWKNTDTAANAVRLTVSQDWYWFIQSNGKIVYRQWIDTTVPFFSWHVLMEVIVNPGNATGTDVYGPGSVVTAYH